MSDGPVAERDDRSRKRPKSCTQRLADAVDEFAGDLSTADAAVLHAMIRHANHATGEGWASQETIARWARCTDRTVREVLGKFCAGAGPVQIVRHARFRADGRGRTSDQWRLVVVDQAACGADSSGPTEVPVEHDQPELTSGRTGGTNRNTVPVSDESGPRLSGSTRTTNRKYTHDQPELTSGDPQSDPCSDPQRSISRARSARRGADSGLSSSGLGKNAASKNGKPERTVEQKAAHTRVMAAYSEEFLRARGEKPPIGGAEATAAYRLLDALQGDADRACSAIRGAYSDPFWSSKSTLRTIASDPARHLGSKPAQPSRRDVPRQRNTTPNPFDRLRKAASNEPSKSQSH